MLSPRRRVGRRLATCTKLIFTVLGSLWLITRAFIIMCRWSETPAYGTCSGIIDHMCAEYSRNRLSGNLCLELCQNTSSERFHCAHISGEGKKVIIYTQSSNKKMVLKAKSFKPEQLQLTHLNLLKDTMSHQPLAETKKFLKTISKDLFKTDKSFNRFIEHVDLDFHTAIAAVASGESLLDQEEYVTVNSLQGTGIVPEIYGTCGNFYAVEYTPIHKAVRVNSLKAGWPWRSIGTWADRRTAAISLIELSERLDKQNLMYCDVKGENFGWLEDGRAVLLDSDTLFSRQELGQTMLNDSCRTSYDCSFWDCHGTCNRRTRRCTADVANTNFQAICVKIFRHHMSNAMHGILEDVPPKRVEVISKFMAMCDSWRLPARETRIALNGIRKQLLHDQILG